MWGKQRHIVTRMWLTKRETIHALTSPRFHSLLTGGSLRIDRTLSHSFSSSKAGMACNFSLDTLKSSIRSALFETAEACAGWTIAPAAAADIELAALLTKRRRVLIDGVIPVVVVTPPPAMLHADTINVSRNVAMRSPINAAVNEEHVIILILIQSVFSNNVK